MKKYFFFYILSIFILIITQSCEAPATTFDPINPNLSEEAVLGAPNSAKRLLNACERQLALCMNELIPLAELASDNYQNTQTFYSQFMDKLDIKSTDSDINEAQFQIARLREMALSGIHTYGPADEKYTENQHAEFFFFVGVAYMLSGEYFKSLPSQVGGVVVPASRHFELADENFRLGAETTIDDDFTKVSCLLGRARSQYALNQKEGAKAAALESIQNAPSFVRYIQYDLLNGLSNNMQDAIADRGAFDDFQPLPRLDFLDPKYNQQDPNQDINIPLLKIEEAYLILAEAAIAESTLSTASMLMERALNVVSNRATHLIDDSTEDRTQDEPGSRPDDIVVRVASSIDTPLRNGLVLSRKNGSVSIPAISGTSINISHINAITNEYEATYLLYLMRQEIFMAEGRRMTDLGIKLVVSDVEQQTNAHVNDTDTQAVLPPFIESIKTELDDFTYNTVNHQVIIQHDLNAIIALNRASSFVCPFQ